MQLLLTTCAQVRLISPVYMHDVCICEQVEPTLLFALQRTKAYCQVTRAKGTLSESTNSLYVATILVNTALASQHDTFMGKFDACSLDVVSCRHSHSLHAGRLCCVR